MVRSPLQQPMGQANRLLVLGTILSLAAPAALLSIGSPVQAQTSSQERLATTEQNESYVGVWALTDNLNTLFNVRVFAGGRAVSTIGTAGVPAAGAGRLKASQFRELGRWAAWGNGIRIDYDNGWTDWIYVSPTGMALSSWKPGQPRGERPFNFGPAVKLSGAAADAVGVYSFPPAQQELKPYTATLLSNGLAFNNIDNQAGGIWRLEGNTVVIEWISGWRTTMSLAPSTRLQLRHWAPGRDRNGPPSGGVRQASLIQ